MFVLFSVNVFEGDQTFIQHYARIFFNQFSTDRLKMMDTSSSEDDDEGLQTPSSFATQVIPVILQIVFIF